MVTGGGPFREAAFRPDRVRASGTCPWCRAEVSFDEAGPTAVCASCGARFAIEAAQGRVPRLAPEPPPLPEPVALVEEPPAPLAVVAPPRARHEAEPPVVTAVGVGISIIGIAVEPAAFPFFLAMLGVMIWRAVRR